ncbi:HNH endonuclease [Agromyces sp. ZXT2-3]|uniref:HNH endonuclease n=1 Tax=Agromyces sp. ZXT2-3 TaxID=3461152 RepID=UPI004054F38D
MGQAWLMIASGSPGRAQGSAYGDAIGRTYVWDSRVPNHHLPQVGDLLLLRGDTEFLGASVIESIEREDGTKLRLRCPRCGLHQVAERSTVSPRYRCMKCHETFDEPDVETIPVTRYRARYDSSWVEAQTSIALSDIRAHLVHPASQHSISPLRHEDLDSLLDATLVRGASMIRRARSVIEGHAEAMVRVRRGQQAFRSMLLDRHGQNCAFLGPTPSAALEAAHLYRYSREGKHHEDGGLLLRADLHTLFDRGLLAVDPRVLQIDVAEEIRAFDAYRALHRTSLRVDPTPQQRSWFAIHWEEHRDSGAE